MKRRYNSNQVRVVSGRPSGPAGSTPSSLRGIGSGISGDVTTPNPWRAAYVDPSSPSRAQSHIVFGAVSRFEWEGSGNLSVKAALSGRFDVFADGGKHRVEPGSYLTLCHGREYRIEFLSSEPIETVSLYFAPKFVQAAWNDRFASPDNRLDSPQSAPFTSSSCYERIFSGDALAERLPTIYASAHRFHDDRLWTQETLLTALNMLFDRQLEARREAASVTAVRSVTKEELYRRLYKARDYAYSTIDQSVSLDDLSYVACLSTNYFLRSFRSLFQQTPHQFIIEQRIERAKTMLLSSDASVSEVCLAVGFQSLGSFSWLFKKRTGHSPEAFRRAMRER